MQIITSLLNNSCSIFGFHMYFTPWRKKAYSQQGCFSLINHDEMPSPTQHKKAICCVTSTFFLRGHIVKAGNHFSS
jgi:hypothetical protein